MPNITIDFYMAKNKGVYIDQEKEKLLGTVIKEINNPFYAICQKINLSKYERDMDEVGKEICLTILAEELFAFIKKLKEKAWAKKNTGYRAYICE